MPSLKTPPSAQPVGRCVFACDFSDVCPKKSPHLVWLRLEYLPGSSSVHHRCWRCRRECTSLAIRSAWSARSFFFFRCGKLHFWLYHLCHLLKYQSISTRTTVFANHLRIKMDNSNISNHFSAPKLCCQVSTLGRWFGLWLGSSWILSFHDTNP